MSDHTASPSQPTAEPRRLTRVRAGKMLAGVSTGLARYLDVDPGVGIVLYLACWVLMPQE